ncbi:MAG: response regulator [Candidatus Marinimicrobia bacterium]|nr:response regulator [Candidatus Neomarinimicrobiota bacterium]
MGKKILVVDDEPQIVRLLSQRLKANGYETFAAHDTYQCIKMAQEVKPDLILVDIKMPAGGGIQAFEILKASIYTSSIPIIFITAYPGDEVKNQVKELGADGFFAKPFNSADLLQKIDELIGK